MNSEAESRANFPLRGKSCEAGIGVHFHAPKARLYGFSIPRSGIIKLIARRAIPPPSVQRAVAPPFTQPAAAGGHNLQPRRGWPPSPLNLLNPLNPLNPGREAALMHNKKSAKLLFSGFHGDPRGIRTPDTLIRSQVLYPAELLGQIGRGRGTQTPNLRFWRPLLYQLRYAPRRMFLATVLS